MTTFRLDEAAWTGRWRRRAVGEKALLCLGLLLVATTSGSPLVTAVTLGCTLVLTLGVARVPWRRYLLTWLGPASFILIGALTVAVTLGRPVDPLWHWGPLVLEREALGRAGTVLLRALAGVAALLLLAMTTPLSDLLSGLRRLGVPGPIVDVALLMYRMLFGLLDAAAQIRECQAARLGFVDGPAARRSMGMLAAATLRRAWQRAQHLEDGLAGRGYTGDLPVLGRQVPLSVPFVTGSVALVAGLAGWSILEALR